MNNLFIITWFNITLATSCAIWAPSSPKATSPHSLKKKLSHRQSKYYLTDKSGQYVEIRERFFDSKTKNFVLKRKVVDKENQSKVLEKNISFSTPGMLNKIPSLRPNISQYTVWFDKKKYFSELKINTYTRNLDIRLNSPKKQWNGTQSIPFPKGTGVFCFFSQLIECVKATNFFTEATSRKVGQMTFHVIWDGYPYFQQQYGHVPEAVFSMANFVYVGQSKLGDVRFELTIADQIIQYHLDSSMDFKKMFWVEQGVSLVRIKKK
ncbi:MAG: hypothetical protein ISR65_02615 [Bacteriovoracaceae bacterium]|nr:hypothetical protein [Bacteriovoracaceae bacterium]